MLIIDVVGIPSDPDGDLDVVEDLRYPRMEIEDLELDRVPIKDESPSDHCSPVGTKNVAIDKFKCNQGRPRCHKSDTIATTTTTSATTKFRRNSPPCIATMHQKICNPNQTLLYCRSEATNAGMVAIAPFYCNTRHANATQK